MEKQNYENHIRWYPPHHFIFYPLVAVLECVSAFYAVQDASNRALWVMFMLLIGIVCWVSLMLRQHYSLLLQNRTVRLELRLRYYILTQKRFEELENKLTKGQMFALRFASDEELVSLIERALAENLSGDQIKRAIKNWLPDEMRV